MGEVHQVYLNRPDSSYQWGFRLEGGSDLASPIRIQKVSRNSISDRSGLQENDLVIRINNQEVHYLTHEQAKMEIIRSGNDVSMLVQRGGPTIWKPSITPVALVQQEYAPSPQAPSSPVVSDVPFVTRTSLTANRAPTSSYTPQCHNAMPQPFQAAVEGGLVTETPDGRTKKIVHSQYNSPMGLYSKSNAESQFQQSVQQVLPTNVAPSSNLSSSGFRNIQAPTPSAHPPSAAPSQASMFCGACGDMIKGVFVKVQGRIPMHPSCLKCVKCGVGLRNVGYFFIDGQLYCETHAKQVSRPPGPGLEAVPMYR